MNKFSFLKVFNSPFKIPKIRIYIGEVALGTPIFYPRRWVKSDKPGCTKPVPKKIGFDFVGLGWKSKWDDTDYRFEWGPIWSFVFFKWQVAITFEVPSIDHYWEAWLYYERNTDHSKSKTDRIKECKEKFPMVYTSHYGDGKKETFDYYLTILKDKYK